MKKNENKTSATINPEATTKRRGRPKMTDEQKAAAAAAREAKKKAQAKAADPDDIDIPVDNPDDDPNTAGGPTFDNAFGFDDLGDEWGSDGSDEETGEAEDDTFDRDWFKGGRKSASVTSDIPTKDVSQ